MKKKLIVFLLLLPFILTLYAMAEPQLGYVTDAASILSSTELDALESKAASISQQYNCGVYIVTVNDYRSYTRGTSIEDCSEDIMYDYSLGLGESQDCIMLLLSMGERDFDLHAHGYLGNAAFTDYGMDQLEDLFLDDFRYDDWYEGFDDYLDGCGEYLRLAVEEGNPVGGDVRGASSGGVSAGTVLIFLLVPLFIAFLVCTILLRQMKSVAKAASASAYVVPGSLNMRVALDQFTHTTQKRVKVASSDSNRSSPGGSSHHSGKF